MFLKLFKPRLFVLYEFERLDEHNVKDGGKSDDDDGSHDLGPVPYLERWCVGN